MALAFYLCVFIHCVFPPSLPISPPSPPWRSFLSPLPIPLSIPLPPPGGAERTRCRKRRQVLCLLVYIFVNISYSFRISFGLSWHIWAPQFDSYFTMAPPAKRSQKADDTKAGDPDESAAKKLKATSGSTPNAAAGGAPDESPYKKPNTTSEPPPAGGVDATNPGKLEGNSTDSAFDTPIKTKVDGTSVWAASGTPNANGAQGGEAAASGAPKANIGPRTIDKDPPAPPSPARGDGAQCSACCRPPPANAIQLRYSDRQCSS